MKVCFKGLTNIPIIKKGDDIGTLIVSALEKEQILVHDKDIFVVASKIVSKAEGRFLKLSTITPSDEAQKISHKTGRDPRLCQVYINESHKILAVRGNMVITRHKLGFENSNAMVDRSNIALAEEEMVVLLPKNPDQSAENIRQTIKAKTCKEVAVIINDSLGRHDRDGSIGLAIGIAGINHLKIEKKYDLFNRPSNTRIALVDELAAGASAIMGQSDESIPLVHISGIDYTIIENASIKNLLGNTDDLWKNYWKGA